MSTFRSTAGRRPAAGITTLVLLLLISVLLLPMLGCAIAVQGGGGGGRRMLGWRGGSTPGSPLPNQQPGHAACPDPPCRYR